MKGYLRFVKWRKTRKGTLVSRCVQMRRYNVEDEFGRLGFRFVCGLCKGTGKNENDEKQSCKTCLGAGYRLRFDD